MQSIFNVLSLNEAVNNNLHNLETVPLVITGRELSPEYPVGAKVIARRVDPNFYIEWGEAYVLTTSNGVITRKLMPSTDPNKVKCVSADETAFPSFDLDRRLINEFYKITYCLSMK